MKYDVSTPNDMLSLLWLVQTIGSYGDQGAATRKAATDGEGIETYFSIPANRFVPALTSWGNDGQTIVLIEGVTTTAQGLGVYVSASQSMLTLGGITAMAANATAAVAFLKDLLARYGPGPRHWVLVGHSWGGAIAEVMACYLLARAAGDEVQVLSAGSPRPGDATVRDKLSGQKVVRLMQPFDPVPHFPPHVDEAPVLTVAAGFAVAYIWSKYVQPGGGLILDAMGGLTDAQLSPFGFPIYDPTLALWVGSTSFITHPQHSLASYVAALGQVVKQARNGYESRPLLPPGEGEIVLTTGVFAAVSSVVQTSQQSPPQEGIGMALYIPLAHRPVIRRVGVAYWVVWEGVTLLKCTTLSHARTIRKYLLKWLRTLDDSFVVYAASFPTAFSTFLSSAGNPAGGFRPVLTVS